MKRGRPKKHRYTGRRYWYPTEYIARMVNEYIEETGIRVCDFAKRAGMPPRDLYNLRYVSRSERTELGVVDRLCVAMDIHLRELEMEPAR